MSTPLAKSVDVHSLRRLATAADKLDSCIADLAYGEHGVNVKLRGTLVFEAYDDNGERCQLKVKIPYHEGMPCILEVMS